MLHRRSLLLLTTALAFAAVLPEAAQTQSGSTLHLALKGYDPVAYFVIGQPMEGSPEFETVFDEVRYRFASMEHQGLFLADPDRYAPQFAGACTKGLSKGVKVEANPLLWRIIDGKLYVFAGTAVPPEMDSDPQALISKAQENWQELKNQPF
ncbi:MAG TPA: YHS domain-containing (seleno)protein [Kiloniellales bacterium]|nr:YHS domain-containing (seleno)protein [Kiloniellales bacterium]